jgi:hypothetical protein
MTPPHVRYLAVGCIVFAVEPDGQQEFICSVPPRMGCRLAARIAALLNLADRGELEQPTEQR